MPETTWRIKKKQHLFYRSTHILIVNEGKCGINPPELMMMDPSVVESVWSSGVSA